MQQFWAAPVSHLSDTSLSAKFSYEAIPDCACISFVLYLICIVTSATVRFSGSIVLELVRCPRVISAQADVDVFPALIVDIDQIL